MYYICIIFIDNGIIYIISLFFLLIMNPEHLQLFIRISQTHNISQAGQALGLSPAVASSYINKLENHLRCRLLHRTTRKVSLTEDGEAFLPHAEDVLASIEAAEAAVGARETLPSGILRIAAPASFGRIHLMPAMKGFMDANPQLNVDCRFSDSVVDLVEGGFDIAIRNAELKNSTLIARKLSPDHRTICASPEYLNEFGEPFTPKELLGHQCITLQGLENWQFESGKEKITIKIQGAFRSDNGEAVRDACLNGLGITVCSNWIAYEHFKKGALIPILKDFPLISNTALWAVYPSTRQLAPKVRAFIDYFVGVFGETPYWDEILGSE